MIESNYFIMKLIVGRSFALSLFVGYGGVFLPRNHIHETECLKLLTEMEKLVRLVDYNFTTTTTASQQNGENLPKKNQPWKLCG